MNNGNLFLYDVDEILNSIPSGEVESSFINADEILKETEELLEDQKKNPIIEDPKSSTSSSKEIMDITSILKEKNQNKSKYKNSIEFIC